MMHPTQVNNFVEIAEIACQRMFDAGYKKFLIEKISWNDVDDYWHVYFYCEVGNIEKVFVALEPYKDSYRVKGLMGI